MERGIEGCISELTTTTVSTTGGSISQDLLRSLGTCVSNSGLHKDGSVYAMAPTWHYYFPTLGCTCVRVGWIPKVMLYSEVRGAPGPGAWLPETWSGNRADGACMQLVEACSGAGSHSRHWNRKGVRPNGFEVASRQSLIRPSYTVSQHPGFFFPPWYSFMPVFLNFLMAIPLLG